MSETDADEPVSRRGFLRTAAGTAAVVGASGTAAAQEGGSGSTSQSVAVGAGSGLSFDPADLTVAPGTTVTWEWTGEGGAHNVVAEDDTFNSGEPQEGSGVTFEYTFEETGEFPYHCEPHQNAGMVGSVVVQEGGASSGGSSEPAVPNSAKTLGVAAMSFMLSTLGLAYVFMKYGGDYRSTSEE